MVRVGSRQFEQFWFWLVNGAYGDIFPRQAHVNLA